MKIIKIWADTHSTGIFDEVGEFYHKDETTISNSTWKELQKWVDDYDDIVVMDDEERVLYKDEIKELDKRGMKLKNEIAKQWEKDINTGEELKFIYYSEGLMEVIINVV